jgi:hypothetical protein
MISRIFLRVQSQFLKKGKLQNGGRSSDLIRELTREPTSDPNKGIKKR